MTDAELKEVLEYALGGFAPRGFLEHIIKHRHAWDAEFRRRIDAYAFELRPDLAVWELEVDDRGRLTEQRLPLLASQT